MMALTASGAVRVTRHRDASCEGATLACHSLFLSPRHMSSILGNKFDHGAESVMPILLNLVPNSAKVMATSGVAAIRLILRVRRLRMMNLH